MIPTVKESTGRLLQQELILEPDLVATELQKLCVSNPYVADFIANMSLGSTDSGKVLYAGILVYKLLEMQAELDNKSKENQ